MKITFPSAEEEEEMAPWDREFKMTQMSDRLLTISRPEDKRPCLQINEFFKMIYWFQSLVTSVTLGGVVY